MGKQRWTVLTGGAFAIATACISLVATGCDNVGRQIPSSSGVVATKVTGSGQEAAVDPGVSSDSPAVTIPPIKDNPPGPANSPATSTPIIKDNPAGPDSSPAPPSHTARDQLRTPGNGNTPELPSFTAPKPQLNAESPSTDEPGQGGDVLPPRREPASSGVDRGRFNSDLLPQNGHPAGNTTGNTKNQRTPLQDSKIQSGPKKQSPLVGKTAPSNSNKDQRFGATDLLPDPRHGRWKTTPPSPGATSQQNSKTGHKCGRGHQTSGPNSTKECSS